MPTPSRLEDILLRSREGTRGIRYTLFRFLDDGVSLLRMRSVSRALHDLISHHKDRIFRRLFLRLADLGLESAQQRTLENIAQHCRCLTISIGDTKPGSAGMQSPSNPSRELKSLYSHDSGSDPGAISPTERFGRRQAQRKWLSLLSHFVNLCSLTLRIHGDQNWPGFTNVEANLTGIRAAMERAGLTRLRSLTLMPVHAMGIVHLQWSMLHSYGQSSVSGSTIWQRLETLDLRIHKPLNLTEPQTVMFNKQLHVYLASFAPTLRQLCLVWLDGNGPSPLTLHHEADLELRRPTVWTKLEGLWLGNVTHLNRTIRLIPDLAPGLSSTMTLRNDHQSR